MLGDAQIERYSRQIILPQVGGRGQEKILQSRVYVDGDGLLAATALLYLVAAGVGTVGLARSKAAPVFSALAEQSLQPDEQPVAHTLRRLNPDCTIMVQPAGDKQPTRHYDLVLATTAALHDEWYAQRKPFVWGAINGEDARLFVSRGDRADRPCLRCLFSERVNIPSDRQAKAGQVDSFPSADPTDSPILSPPYALFLGTQLVTEVLKIILQPEVDSQPKLLEWTFPAFHCTERTVEKNPHCAVCSTSVQSAGQSA